MKLLVDAQLPRRLSEFLNGLGHDSVHTLDLPTGNRTTDDEINIRTIAESRVLITKDADFVDSFLTRKVPFKLLLVATGNIGNDELLDLFRRNSATVVDQFDVHNFIELTRDQVVIHV
jgi:predicted nuclease of predicted toxin-antitoxin system